MCIRDRLAATEVDEQHHRFLGTSASQDRLTEGATGVGVEHAVFFEFGEGIGRAFREAILARGGSQEPMVLFVDFRGREPSIDALLRHSGLTEDAAA